MPITAGPIYPGIKKGLVFAIDPANKDSWAGPTSDTVNNLPAYNSNISGSIFNDTSGSFGISSSFAFDGADDKIYCNYNADLVSTDQTFSIWVSYNSLPTSYGPNPFASYQEGVLGGWALHIGMAGHNYKPTFFSRGGGNTEYVPYGSAISTNTWYNFVIIAKATAYGNGTANLVYSIYQDTVAIATNQTNTRYTLPSTKGFQINNKYNDLNQPYYGGGNCNIGPTMIYNRALSEGEILQNYNALKGRFGLT